MDHMVHFARTNAVIVLQLMFVRTQMVDVRVIVAMASGERNVLNVSNVFSNLFLLYALSKSKRTIGYLSFRF